MDQSPAAKGGGGQPLGERLPARAPGVSLPELPSASKRPGTVTDTGTGQIKGDLQAKSDSPLNANLCLLKIGLLVYIRTRS